MAESPQPTTGSPVEPEEQPGRRSSDWLPSVQLTVLSIVVALAVGAVLIAVSDRGVIAAVGDGDVGAFFSAVGHAIGGSYAALLDGAVGGWGAISQTLQRSAPLICAGLGVTLAFRCGLFNIGAQGQLVLGAIFAGYVGFGWSLPPGIHLLAAVIAALVGGALWGAIAGVLKARTGAHEVISTIMLNYVAANLLLYLLGTDAFQRPGSINPRSQPVDDSATFPVVFSTHTGVLVAFAATVLVWWVLERTTLGFQMRAVGANPDAARTAGMSVTRLYTTAMLLAGALAGLGAAMEILGDHLSLTPSFAGEIGFDAITVSLLGRATPLGTLLAGLLFGALEAGGVSMQASAGTPIQLTAVIQALIVLFVAAPAAVRGLLRLKTRGGGTTMLAKGWGS